MTDLRDPPYPADTRAKGWRFEVDMEKVKASDTWLRAKSGMVRGALLLLWAEAWQQNPCGTLPNDDELVALLIDMSPVVFTKHRSVLMRGWWQASDGRLYHETITDRVLSMLDKRASDAQRAAARRARNADKPATPPGVTPESRVTNDGSPREFDTKHQAPSTRTSEEKEMPPAARVPPAKPVPERGEGRFPEFWESWPKTDRKQDRKKCLDKWRGKHCDGIADQIIEHVSRLKATRKWIEGFEPAPLTYLNGDRWNDGVEPLPASLSPPGAAPNRQEAIEQSNRQIAARWAAQGVPNETV